MRRLIRYWAIRLLGREFVALSPMARVVGLWWCFAVAIACGWSVENPLWTHLFVVGNFVASSWAARIVFSDHYKP